MEYPRVQGARRKPDENKDGSKNYGKPCVVCGVGTCGEKWIQFNYMRGDDETVRVCHDHWNSDNDLIIKKSLESQMDSVLQGDNDEV